MLMPGAFGQRLAEFSFETLFAVDPFVFKGVRKLTEDVEPILHALRQPIINDLVAAAFVNQAQHVDAVTQTGRTV